MSDEEVMQWENVNNYGYMMCERMFDITEDEIKKEIIKQFDW